LRRRKGHVNFGPMDRPDGNMMQRTTGTREYESIRWADGSRRGKSDLDNEDQRSTHLAKGSQWMKPGLESDEDRGSTYLNEWDRRRKPDLDDRSRGSTHLAHDSQRGKPDLVYACKASNEDEHRRQAPHVKYGKTKAIEPLMRRVADPLGGHGAGIKADI
jgi:hypothetical protein